jgi:thiol-disulfide isomerase/thioredoxin
VLRLRMASLIFLLQLLPVASPAGAAPAATVVPGETAPPLVVARWLKGEPVNRFEPGRIYVVDLWSLWCKPCLTTMPLLSRIQGRYEKDVTVIGMNVWEMTPARVPEYIRSQGDSMAITVAADSIPPGKEANEGLTAISYLGTSEHVAIPRTILIDREGRVAWVGTPDGLEKVIVQVIDGTWDVKPFANGFAAEERLERKYEELFRLVEGAVGEYSWQKALAASESVAVADSSFVERIAHQGFKYIASSILRKENASPADLSLAQRSAERALALMEKPRSSDYQIAAQAAQRAGNLKQAKMYMQSAIERAEGEERAKLEKELEQMR